MPFDLRHTGTSGGCAARRSAVTPSPCAIGRGGFTLVELMVVVTIVIILIGALGFEFTQWRTRYVTEAQLKEFYVDLSNARIKAMETRKIYFVNMSSPDWNSYRIYVDNSPAPDGDGVLDETKDTKIIDKTIRYRFITQLSFFGFMKNGLLYNSSGVVESPRTVRLVRKDYVATDPGTHLAADLDCIEAVSTRINLGLYKGNVCEDR